MPTVKRHRGALSRLAIAMAFALVSLMLTTGVASGHAMPGTSGSWVYGNCSWYGWHANPGDFSQIEGVTESDADSDCGSPYGAISLRLKITKGGVAMYRSWTHPYFLWRAWDPGYPFTFNWSEHKIRGAYMKDDWAMVRYLY